MTKPNPYENFLRPSPTVQPEQRPTPTVQPEQKGQIDPVAFTPMRAVDVIAGFGLFVWRMIILILAIFMYVLFSHF